MAVRKLTVAEHYRNYEDLTASFGLSKHDGLPEFDYVSHDILKKIHRAAGGFNKSFQDDITLILTNYFANGRRIFELFERNPRSQMYQNVQKALLKYKIIEHIAQNLQHRRHQFITIEQLLMCVPHIAAKIYILDLDIEPSMDSTTVELNHFHNISPACALLSSFALLPQYKEDADDEFLNIVKTMLLFQYEELEAVETRNHRYTLHSPARKMRRLINMAKVVYESYHMCSDMRWFCYQSFFLKQFTTLKNYEYSEAAAIFDQRFQQQVSEVNNAFELRLGSKRTLNLSMDNIADMMSKVTF